jgi:hypothetical protein
MHCYECKKRGESEEAVALCPTCSVGLCLPHLREMANAVSGMTWFNCPHDAMRRTAAAAVSPAR